MDEGDGWADRWRRRAELRAAYLGILGTCDSLPPLREALFVVVFVCYLQLFSERDAGRPIVTEVEPAAAFYDAEAYHMQYLQKRGQSARKDDPAPIRCYG